MRACVNAIDSLCCGSGKRMEQSPPELLVQPVEHFDVCRKRSWPERYKHKKHISKDLLQVCRSVIGIVKFFFLPASRDKTDQMPKRGQTEHQAKLDKLRLACSLV